MFSLGPIPDFAGDFDNINYPIDTRSNTRSDSTASGTTATTSDSASTNTGRISPVSSKKKGFSKFFGVFTGRSGSISSASTPANHVYNDGSSSNSQTPSTPEGTMTLGRVAPSSSKEPVKRSRSIVIDFLIFLFSFVKYSFSEIKSSTCSFYRSTYFSP
jgi:hypothetical protein